VKRKVNSAVALASWVLMPAKKMKAGINRIPPTPTVPMKVPASNAIKARRMEFNLYLD
jgi:hypothetical protein